jgi:hypothetical protein
MKRLFGAAVATLLLLQCCSLPVMAAGPYADGVFRGRIAWSADGNHNDPDDWAASPLALAIIAEAELKDRLVHFDYNCILPQTNAEWEKIHAESVLGAARHYGFELGRFFDCRQDAEAAITDLARAIDASSAEDPLFFVVAGPMEVPLRGIEKSRPDKRPFVYCISHSRWNDGFAATYKFTHTKRSVIESGVNWVQIQDQNRLLSLSPYGKPGPPESFARYQWMRDSQDKRVQFLWERLLVSTRPDPSDAGMAWFLVTGDEQADPEKLRRLLDDKIIPQPVVRKEIRLEAENFRQLGGFEVEDRNDRTASHRLSVKRTGRSDNRGIQTHYREPYAPQRGRFDVSIRYRPLGNGNGNGEGDGIQLLINGAEATSESPPSGNDQGWRRKTFTNVSLAEGDTITVNAPGDPVSIDYVQLNLR